MIKIDFENIKDIKTTCVYMYINTINNKIYIGQTNNLERRHKEHINSSYNEKAKDYNVPFHKAIRKYGIEIFELFILEQELTREELNELEEEYIKEYNSLSKQDGYNIRGGGDYTYSLEGKTEEEKREIYKKIGENKKGKELSQEHKDKIREAKQGTTLTQEHKDKISKTLKEGYENNSHKRIEYTDELRDKMSKSQKQKYDNGYINPMQNKHHTEETKQLLSNKWKEKYENGYVSHSLGQKRTEEQKKKMSDAKKGKALSEEHKQRIKDGAKKGKDNINSVKVIQYTKDMVFIKEWDSFMDIERELGLPHGNIGKCCRGITKSAYGFVWRYSEQK